MISDSGEIQLRDAGDSQLAGMMKLSDAAMVGAMEFDVDRGRLLKNTATTTMKMTVSAGGQEMVMGSIGTVTMEIVEG